MNNDQLKQSFDQLLKVTPPLQQINDLYNKAIECGALDIKAEEAGDFRLAKIIYYAILCTMAEQWRPTHADNRKEAENLQLFL